MASAKVKALLVAVGVAAVGIAMEAVAYRLNAMWIAPSCVLQLTADAISTATYFCAYYIARMLDVSKVLNLLP